MKAYEGDPVDRFWLLVEKTPTCWVFRGGGRGDGGAPLFELTGRPSRRRVFAQRYAWELAHGPMPRGKVPILTCGEPLCVRPDHMTAGSKADRVPDSVYAERLWSRVQKRPNGCWEWPTATGGYGRLTYRNKPFGTHVLAWTLTHGPVPAGMFVCHRCDNPPCCNPGHLFLADPAGNSADMVAKGRARVGDLSRRRKLSDEQVQEIRARYAAGGVSTHQLAREYGVASMVVWNVVAQRSYLSVT